MISREIECKEPPRLGLQLVRLSDMNKVLDLARRSYPPTKQDAVINSFNFYAECLRVDLDDGRKFYKWQEGDRILGVCGVQKRAEDPTGVCWGSWFFIDPERRGTTLPYRMGVDFLNKVKTAGNSRMYVETTLDNPKYYNIASSLEQVGFQVVSRIPDFHESGIDAVTYAVDLQSWRPPFI
jgi:hypothetical protein